MHPTEDALNEYADDTLGAAARSDVDRHVASCAECRRTVDGLREIRQAAAALEPRDVPIRAWVRVERAIKLEREHAAPRTRPFVWTSLAAAAALLLAVAGGVRMLSTSPRTPPAAASRQTRPADDAAPPASAAAQSVEIELRQAEDHYEKAIKGLEEITRTEQGALDPKTAATLQKNLAVIDQAIGESRAALRVQPASEPAQQSLLENFRSKIGLLQDTVSLINEMRKGNDAGAARIVSGLKQKGD